MLKLKPPKHFKRNAFTLIELLVVLAILAAIAAIGLPRIASRNDEIRSTVRKLKVIGKELQTQARLQNKTFRIVFEMVPDEPHRMWVESASGQIIVDRELQREFDEADESEREEMLDPKLASFQPDTRVIKKPIQVPLPIYFKDVQVGSSEEVVSEGKAYVHFFPQGMIEEAAIHITDGRDINWTVTFNPLTGKGHIISSYVTLEDLRGR